MSRKSSIVFGACLAGFLITGCATQEGPAPQGAVSVDQQPMDAIDLKPDGAVLRAFEELARSDIRLRKSAILAEYMNLTEDEAIEFWPLHREYEIEFARVTDRKISLIRRYAGRADSLSDSDARTIAAEVFDVEQARVDLKRRYFGKFSRVVPASKVVRFFQIENQLNMAIDLQIAAAIPLAR